jgi:hypothetical protein
MLYCKGGDGDPLLVRHLDQIFSPKNGVSTHEENKIIRRYRET